MAPRPPLPARTTDRLTPPRPPLLCTLSAVLVGSRKFPPERLHLMGTGAGGVRMAAMISSPPCGAPRVYFCGMYSQLYHIPSTPYALRGRICRDGVPQTTPYLLTQGSPLVCLPCVCRGPGLVRALDWSWRCCSRPSCLFRPAGCHLSRPLTIDRYVCMYVCMYLCMYIPCTARSLGSEISSCDRHLPLLILTYYTPSPPCALPRIWVLAGEGQKKKPGGHPPAPRQPVSHGVNSRPTHQSQSYLQTRGLHGTMVPLRLKPPCPVQKPNRVGYIQVD